MPQSTSVETFLWNIWASYRMTGPILVGLGWFWRLLISPLELSHSSSRSWTYPHLDPHSNLPRDHCSSIHQVPHRARWLMGIHGRQFSPTWPWCTSIILPTCLGRVGHHPRNDEGVEERDRRGGSVGSTCWKCGSWVREKAMERNCLGDSLVCQSACEYDGISPFWLRRLTFL